MTNTSVKPRIKSKSRSALRYEVRALRAASGERSKGQPGSTTALIPRTILRDHDDIDEFFEGCFEVDVDADFDPDCGDAQYQEKATLLLRRSPLQLTAREKGFLYAIVKWRGPHVIPVEHRRKIHRLFKKLHDAEKSPW
jgi:hypothetical protein